MKTKTLVLIGVLIIALAAMAMPVMAASATISGTLAPAISVSVTGGDAISLTLNPTATPAISNNAALLSVTTNTPTWYVTATDDLTSDGTNAKPGTAGYMAEADADSKWVTASTKYLNTEMSVTGPTIAAATAATTALTASGNHRIETGTAATGSTPQTGYITFTQPVTFADQIPTGTNKYMMIVTISGTLT